MLVDVLGPDNDILQLDRGQMILDWFAKRYGAHGRHFLAIDDLDLGYTDHAIPFFQTDPKKGLAGLDDSAYEHMESILLRKDIKT